AEELSASEWEAASRSGRGRRDSDAPFRICGKNLLLHIMAEKMCQPDNCPPKKRFAGSVGGAFDRHRRAISTKQITTLCCENECRPSDVRALCC
ncbi:hypothetical protein PMAYCL1PPCAC_08565, partial [Pristionchus mayeri]